MSFAQNLAALMAQRAVGQSDLARSIGVSSQAVNQWLSGSTRPRVASMQDVANFFGVPLSSLLDGQGTAASPRLTPTDLNLPASRIAAVRRCVWPAIEQAAADLSIPLAHIEAVETGTAQLSPAQLLRFCARAGCTEGFIARGDMDGVRWELVAWLGHTAPDLVPGLLAMAARAQAAAGENEA